MLLLGQYLLIISVNSQSTISSSMHFVTVTLWHLTSVGSNFGIFMGFFLIHKKFPQRKVLAFFLQKFTPLLNFTQKSFSLQTRWYTSPRFSNSTLYNITIWKKNNGIAVSSTYWNWYYGVQKESATDQLSRPQKSESFIGSGHFSFVTMKRSETMMCTLLSGSIALVYKVESNNTALSPDPSESATDDNKLLITIHIYLTTGVILFRGWKRI